MANVTTDLVITFITIVLDICACLMSFIVFILIISYLFSNQTKKEEKVTLILSAYIMVFIVAYGTTIIVLCVNIILDELYGGDFVLSACIFSGYLVTVLTFAIYSVFVSQAIFRLFRIVYSFYKRLQLFWLYTFAGPLGLILGFAILSPLLIWNDIQYIPTEHYCFVPFLHLRGILWVTSSSYGFPLLALLIIYIRVTRFIHYQSNNHTLVMQRRHERDLLVIRRIIIIVGMLTVAGIPTVIVLIVANITGVEQSILYRIQCLSGAIFLLELSITIVMFTPQLKSIVLKKWRGNRVGYANSHVGNTIPMRNIQ